MLVQGTESSVFPITWALEEEEEIGLKTGAVLILPVPLLGQDAHSKHLPGSPEAPCSPEASVTCSTEAAGIAYPDRMLSKVLVEREMLFTWCFKNETCFLRN